MLNPLRFASAAALACCLIAVPAYSQEISSPEPAPAPANLAFIDGAVDVIQGGVAEAADPPLMLIEGDVVRTRSGRAEIVFGDGTLLHLSADSEIEILGDERLRLLTGRVIVRMSHAAARPYVVDTPASSVRLDAQGEYTITSERAGRLEVAVVRGAATINDAQQWSIRGGQMLTLLGAGGRPLIASFNSARQDAFAAWSHDRANGFASSSSAAQLPYELRPYAPVLESHGRWDYLAPHGYVWFPSVGANWRPYYDGSWSFTRYGWTWHGRDRWAWPTHHYGRWGYTGSFWYWMPATTWAPAWVTWSVASGYVSWAPLGWHGRFDGWGRRDHAAYAPNYNPWRGWTVLPRHQFGPRRNVRSYAIDGDRLDDVTRRVLLERATPARPVDDIAVPRDSVRTPGARGNVRRPPQTPRAEIPPVRGNARTDDPSYTPPSSFGRAAGRTPGSDGARRSAPTDGSDSSTGRGAVERRSTPAPRAGASERGRTSERGAASERGGTSERGTASGRSDGSERGGASERRGADRDPGTRAAPRSAPRGEAPTTRQPQPNGGSSGGAVPRSGASRRKG